MEEPTIYIIDDDPALVESLGWIIESIGLKIKSFYNAKAFLNQTFPLSHGCILLDVRMSEMSGPELQVQLNQKENALPIIFISGYGDVPLAVRIMKEGAVDFLLKPFNDHILLETINKALSIDSKNREKTSYHSKTKQRLDSLSKREQEVLLGIVNGKQNKDISRALNLSLKTIEAHRGSLMRKMNVKSVSELVKIAILHNNLDIV